MIGLRKTINTIWPLTKAVGDVIGKRKSDDTKITIGVVTYIARYDMYFKTLISDLARIFPKSEIIVAVNGYHDIEAQIKYLAQIREYCEKYNNVKLLTREAPAGLTVLWNEIMEKSEYPKTLILNDDLAFAEAFRFDLKKALKDKKNIVTLFNRSWSHFIMPKSLWEKIGPFDENFTEVGSEDWDYECRLALVGSYPKNFRTLWIKNFVHLTKDFSYLDVKIVHGKYGSKNSQYFHDKWSRCESGVFVEILNSKIKLN